MAMHRVRMRSAVLEALETQTSLNIKLKVEVTHVNLVESFDGEINEQTVKTPMTTSNAWTIAKGNVKVSSKQPER